MLVGGFLYLAVGEVGKIGDFEVEAVECDVSNCNVCALKNLTTCHVFGPCENRPDGKDVVFIKKETDERSQ